MQTFCTEGLTISEGNIIFFKPDYIPRQPTTYTLISFLNVPLETEEKQMDAYVREHCTIHGVHYPRQKIENITYQTGTRTYRVSNIIEHFQKSDHIFGRWVRIIYNGQPDRRKQPSDKIENDHEQPQTRMERGNDNLTTTSEASTSKIPAEPTIIQETPLSQMPPKSTHQIPTNEQPNTSTLLAENEAQVHNDTPTEQTQNTKDSIKLAPHPTMDLTIEEFPTLPTQTPQPNTDTQERTDIADFSDDSVELSPIVTRKLIQTTFKRPGNQTSNSEENQNITQLSIEQQNAVIKICRELHKYSVRDVDKLQHINMDKKRRIISKAMYIQLRNFDPSNECVLNSSDVKTIRLYRRLTENKIDPEILYLQIHNQLAKQDKLK